MIIGRGSSSPSARPRYDRVDLRVHRADDVGGAAAAATSRAGSRPRSAAAATGRAAHPAGGGVVVRAVAALVAERPEDHARMVLVALDHVRDALDPRRLVARVVAELVVERVRLDVRLVDHVQPVAVAEVEPVGVVRVVRRAHGVDVELLHQPHVRLHRLARERAARDVVVLVPVDAVDPHGLAVDEQLRGRAPRRGGSRRRTETVSPSARELERVERRLLGRPQLRRAHLALEAGRRRARPATTRPRASISVTSPSTSASTDSRPLEAASSAARTSRSRDRSGSTR